MTALVLVAVVSVMLAMWSPRLWIIVVTLFITAKLLGYL